MSNIELLSPAGNVEKLKTAINFGADACYMGLTNYSLRKNAGNFKEDELEEKRKDPNYFVSIENNVYKNDQDYAFKRVMIKLKQGRAVYKYGGQKIDSELLTEIDRLIKEKSLK